MKFKNLIFVTLRQLSDFKIGYIFNAMCAIDLYSFSYNKDGGNNNNLL